MPEVLGRERQRPEGEALSRCKTRLLKEPIQLNVTELGTEVVTISFFRDVSAGPTNAAQERFDLLTILTSKRHMPTVADQAAIRRRKTQCVRQPSAPLQRTFAIAASVVAFVLLKGGPTHTSETAVTVRRARDACIGFLRETFGPTFSHGPNVRHEDALVKARAVA